MTSRVAEAPTPEKHVAAAGVRALAAVAWFLPFSALVVLGVSEKGDALVPVSRVPGHALIATVLSVAAFGILAGTIALSRAGADRATRRRAILGAGTSATVLLVALIAFGAGATSEADVKKATADAMRNAPGWNGGARIGDAIITVFEVDASSALAKMIASSVGGRYVVALFGVDNRVAARGIEVALEGARAHHANASVTVAVSSQPAHLAAGERVDGVTALFADDTDFRDVDWIEIHVDGSPVRIPGRFFTIEEKRRIDAARARDVK